MTGDSGGFGGGNGGAGGRHRGRFTENAKSLAAILTGIAALLTAIAGMITLVCSDPVGDPASAATTTVSSVQDTPVAGSGAAAAANPRPTSASRGSPSTAPISAPSPSSGAATGSASISTPAPTAGAASQAGPPSTPPPPAPQWEGDARVDSLGYSLATVPPSPDQSGDPDISATSDGTFFAALGAAKWVGAEAPNPQACAALLGARKTTQVTASPGEVYCVRVAHDAYNPGRQYAAVRVLGQGRDAADSPYIRIHATVWPDQE